jgi:Mg-chelatase subunit ChlD
MVSVIVVVAAVVLSSASGTNEALSMSVSSSTALAGMRRYFARSEEEHSTSMASISRRMNTSAALHILERHEQVTPALVQLARRVVTTRSARHKETSRTFLSASKKQPAGYGGFQPALDMLNSMMYESMKKYDTEIAKCTDYYSKQCGMLEGIRGEVASSNFQAATCREHTLAAQGQIELLQDSIPEKSELLHQNDLKCKHEVMELRRRLKIVLGDIEVLTQIIEMTDCHEKALLQLLHCQSNCTDSKFVAVDHEDVQKHLSQLKSSVAIGLVQQSFADLANENTQSSEVPSNMTLNSKDPVPRTQVPDSPCTDPNQGAPAPYDKRAAKCTVSGTPVCTTIQERFLLVQSGIQDERDDLQNEISKMEGKCEETKSNLEEQVKDANQDLKDEQAKLAESMECEANAGEAGRLSNKEHSSGSADLKEMMKTCTTNYQNFETEICGLRKIRGELYKMRGTGKPPLFQDCQLSPWEAEECSKPCGGGLQKLYRTVSTQPRGGAKCLPLGQMKSCEDQPCPVDCKLEAWDGWSKCSAECGGGVQQRLRDVTRHMKYNGKPCGETSQTKPCNVQSCESDCELSDWTAWSKCSKACDGGTRKRQKFVRTQAKGQGNCPGIWDAERLGYEACNRHSCKINPNAKTLKCKAELDVVLLLDGSGSLGSKGWAASKIAAETFVSAFEGDNTQAHISVILFSGPKFISGVKKCIGGGKEALDMEKDCSIKVVEHLTEDIASVKAKIASLEWPKGSTLTSLALSAAKSELAIGRKDAKSVVVVITDGRPMSYRKTALASRDLRKSARLIWVPVTKFAPLKKIRKWATRRWKENVILVKDFEELEQPRVVSKMIADLCPP